jgi:hypothetical protein
MALKTSAKSQWGSQLAELDGAVKPSRRPPPGQQRQPGLGPADNRQRPAADRHRLDGVTAARPSASSKSRPQLPNVAHVVASVLGRRLVIGGESAGGFTALGALAAERLFFAVGASRYRQPLLVVRHVAGEN